MAITVALAAWFLSHLAAEQAGPLPADGAREQVTHGCTTLRLLGIALVAPRPRPTPGAATTLLSWALRRLAVPTLLGTTVVVLVLGGVDADASPPTLRTAAQEQDRPGGSARTEADRHRCSGRFEVPLPRSWSARGVTDC